MEIGIARAEPRYGQRVLRCVRTSVTSTTRPIDPRVEAVVSELLGAAFDSGVASRSS